MTNNYKVLLITGAGVSAPYILSDCKSALEEIGCEVMTMPASNDPLEFRSILTTIKPHFILSLDHAGINDEIIAQEKVPCFSWFVDNPFYFVNESNKKPYSYFLVTDKSYIKELQHYGFNDVFYLPLAANPKRMHNLNFSNIRQADISFVGTLSKRHTEWRIERNREATSPTKEILDLLVHLKTQKPNMTFDEMFKFCDEKFKEQILQKLDMKARGSIEYRIDMETSSYFRETYIRSLADFNVSIFGNNEWKKVLPEHHFFGGNIDYDKDIGHLYRISKINLNITRTQIQTGINQRILDIAATGAIFLTDYRKTTQDFFDCDLRYLMYHNENDLKEKVEYFLKSKEVRIFIGNELFDSINNKHTYVHRMKELIDIYKKV